MIDSFVLLAPILLLGVVALLRFIGCDLPLGLHEWPSTDVTSIKPVSGPLEGGQSVVVNDGTGARDVLLAGLACYISQGGILRIHGHRQDSKGQRNCGTEK